MKQLHDKSVFSPIITSELNEKERKRAMEGIFSRKKTALSKQEPSYMVAHRENIHLKMM